MTSRFLDELSRRVLLIDGAMGTSIHNCDCELERDYLGKENCTEILVRTRPDVIQGIHETFLEAGADAVETDTFGANKLVFEDFDLVDETYALNKEAAEIARAACDAHSTSDKPRFVLGSMGPGTRLITLGNTTWQLMLDSYAEQVRGLIDGGTDALLIETCQDIMQVKCAVNACLKALEEKGKDPQQIPILVSVTIETTGTMLLGTEMAAAAQALRRLPIASLGLNCATGPTEMAQHITWLSRHWDRHISVVPNAGLPVLVDGKTDYPLKPVPFAEQVAGFAEKFGVSLVGGCCGTTPEHIAELANAIKGIDKRERKTTDWPNGSTSLYSSVEMRQDASILLVGERTNTNGSRRFKRLLDEGDLDGIVSMGKELVRDGSHVLDVCVDFVGRDGVKDMTEVISRFAQQVAAPLMIDSTEIPVIEAGLMHAPGKCIINSMNLEEGEEKLGRICKLAMKYGAAVVAGTIDEDPKEAMAKTADRKIEIAKRIHDLAVNTYGMHASDILFDPLVLPVTTGVEADRRLALETIEGIRRISAELPECQTMIGLSNVSFGLKPAARVVLNSVFMHECRNAGLTGAIVHASKILPKNKIDDARWDAALELIYDRRDNVADPLIAFINLFPDGETEAADEREKLEDLPLEERLQRHIIDGETAGLEAALDEALGTYPPIKIINDHLLSGMKTVGELFGSGEMQLPFVLQSATVMKQSVAYLEPHMDKADTQSKGKIILATVQGDVHDIGKNLVDIILSNNGFDVVNIGIKQPLVAILDALKEHDADAIGLSGLLVKSVGVMQDNLVQMSERGFDVPVILGGAALTRHYAEQTLRDIYPGTYYGKDAFEGLRFMDMLSENKLPEIDGEIVERLTKRADAQKVVDSANAQREREPASVAVLERATRSDVRTDTAVPEAPFWGDRVVEGIDIAEVYPFINEVALFRGQWQFKKGRKSDQEYAAQLEDDIRPLFERMKRECAQILTPKVVYGFYPAQSDGEDLIVFDPQDHDREIERFTFPRQAKRKRLCISDYFRSVESGEKDVLALHCVTVGSDISVRAKELFEADAYSEYLYVHGLGVESAEALAELWHKRVRQELGIGAQDSPAVRELFTQTYRGSRYSFGYPACPEMSDQGKLFGLLRPERIGCELTENWQIDPEQSTSALVVHHPEAKYFAV